MHSSARVGDGQISVVEGIGLGECPQHFACPYVFTLHPTIKTLDTPHTFNLHTIIVPTHDTMRYNYLIDNLLAPCIIEHTLIIH